MVYLMIAEQLTTQGVQVSIVDLTDGWTKSPSVAQRIRKAGIERRSSQSHNWKLALADVILCSAKFVALATRQGRAEGFDVSARLLAWLLHPNELYSNQFRTLKHIATFLRVIPRHSAHLDVALAHLSGHQKLLRKLLATKRLDVMDETTSISLMQHFPWAVPITFPVPSAADDGIMEFRDFEASCPKRRLALLWISRLDGFKIPPLHRTLVELSESDQARRRGVVINIIGDGAGLPFLKSFTATLPAHIRVEFRGFMPIEQLKEFLRTNSIDLAIGMGTSLSLCAVHGIPSVIATAAEDSTAYSLNDSSFRFLGSRRSYSLGEYHNAKPSKFRYFSLDRILSHASSFNSVGRSQVIWHAKTYGDALSKYIGHVHEEAKAVTPLQKCSFAQSIFSKALNFTLCRIAYKNAAFPP